MKTVFVLEAIENLDVFDYGKIKIIGKAPEDSPYVTIECGDESLFIKDKDLKLFAKNLCKALNIKP